MTDDGPARDAPRSPSATASLAGTLGGLDPAYFGLVMSTGIVAIAFDGLGVGAVSWPLTVFNVGCYALLVVLFSLKVVLFPGEVVADLRDRQRHWGTLTFVVATNTVGVQFLQSGATVLAVVLWLTAVVVTPPLLYYLFFTEFVGTRKAAISERIDGAFLLTVVCLQSLAVLGGTLSAEFPAYGSALVLSSMGYFGAGYVLYFVVVTVVTYRLLEGGVRPDDWTGPYWITMGAAAITTLAGTTLGPQLEGVAAWSPYAPVVVGLTFLAWTIASWWIPLLLVVAVWTFLASGIDGQPPGWVVFVPWSRLALGRRLHVYDRRRGDGCSRWGCTLPVR
jgi:tellurite resistance protein TehA-like permease